MNQEHSSSGPARNLVRAFALLDQLATTPHGGTLAELAADAGVPEPTTHRLLNVLQELNVVRVGDGGRWRIGRHCLELGAAYLDSVELRDEAKPVMRKLTEETGETCALGVLDDDRVVYVETVESPHPVRMYTGIGRSNPATTTSLGRAVLAWSPTQVVDRVLEHGIPHRTDNTVATADALRAELAACRERGYSVDDAENELGIRGVGAPVLDYRNTPVAALAVAGPMQRMTPARLGEVGKTTAAAATELSAQLGHRASRTTD